MSTDVATLVLAVDAAQVGAGGNELDKLTQKGKGAEDQTKKLTSATNILSKAYGDIAKAFAAWRVADFIKDATMMAARFETMGIVMQIAGNNAGYTRAQTEEYSKALQKQGISMMQSRDAVVQLATANIDLAKASDLGRAAQDLAVVAGINSSEAMQRMIQGIKSGEIEILRTLGMNVSWEASYKKLAAQLGINSDKLTEQQKVMARTNAVIQEGVKYQGIYEEAMGTAGKAITSLTRYWDNLKIKMGEVFLPALSDAVDGLTRALKASNAEFDKAKTEGTISNYANAIRDLISWSLKAGTVIVSSFGYAGEAISRFVAAAAAQASALASGNITGFREIGRAWREESKTASAAQAAFEAEIWKKKAPSEQTKTSGYDEEARIKAGVAMRAQAEADAKKLLNSASSRKSVESEAKAYDSLAKSIKEKTAAAILEGDGQAVLSDGQKAAAKFTADLAMGELKLTAAHRASITTLLEKQIAIEKQNEMAKAYAEALKAIRLSVVTAEDSTRELNDAQKTLLDLMRAPEWEKMPDVWKQTAIAATATATAQIEVKKNQKEINDLIGQTPTVQLEKQREQMQRLAAAYLDEKFGIVGSTEAMQRYAEVVDVALGRNADTLTKEADALDEFTKSAAQNMQKSLADFLFDPFADGTKTMAQQFGVTVQKMISQAVSADLMKRLFGDMGKTGDIGGWVGDILGGKSSSGLSGLLGSSGGMMEDSGGAFIKTAGSGIMGWLSNLLPSFDVGTEFVPNDMVAQIHKGEKIVPASENKQNNSGNSSGNVYNMNVHLPAGTPSETRRAAGIGAREALAAFSNAQRYA